MCVLLEVFVSMAPRKSLPALLVLSIQTTRERIDKIVLLALQENIVLEAAVEHLLEIVKLATIAQSSQQSKIKYLLIQATTPKQEIQHRLFAKLELITHSLHNLHAYLVVLDFIVTQKECQIK